MEKADINEIVLLLKNNYFEQIDIEDEERLGSFLSLYQVKKELKLPIENNIFSQALSMLGYRTFYKGHTIPADPDKTAFVLRETEEKEVYIQPLIKKNCLNEIDYFIRHDETFNEYMSKLCQTDYDSIKKENHFFVIGTLTTGPSEIFSHLISVGIVEIINGKKTGFEIEFFIDNDLNEQEILNYKTPYKSGYKSKYEQLGIALPGMEECTYKHIFDKRYIFLRKIYKYLKNRNIVVSSPEIFKEFVNKMFVDNKINEEFRVEKIVKNYISVLRSEKYISGEFLTLLEIQNKYKVNNISYNSGLSEAHRISDILIKQMYINISAKKDDS